MTAGTAPLQALIDQARERLPGRDFGWLQSRRAEAARAVADLGLPDRKSEEWRYTSAERLVSHPLHPAAPARLDPAMLDALAVPGLDAWRAVFVNGRLAPAASDLEGLPEGVVVESLRAALEGEDLDLTAWLGRATGDGGHVFNALNTALIDDGLVIHVGPGIELERPLEMLFLTDGDEEGSTASPRNLVVLEAGAQLTLVERHASLGAGMYFNNGVTEVLLGEGARLAHDRLLEEHGAAFHLHGLFLDQAAGSHYAVVNAALGGCWSRTDIHVRFRGEGAECELDGVYLAGDQQLVDMHLDVDHAVPGCASRHNFRGILHGRGRAVFDGRILVRRDAQQTDAHLANANLLLARECEIDTKPQLEIFADDVRCSHGTTVGQIEAEQIFYLRSRGIDADEARRMLCVGFAVEVLDRFRVPGLRERAEERLRAALGQDNRED